MRSEAEATIARSTALATGFKDQVLALRNGLQAQMNQHDEQQQQSSSHDSNSAEFHTRLQLLQQQRDAARAELDKARTVILLMREQVQLVEQSDAWLVDTTHNHHGNSNSNSNSNSEKQASSVVSWNSDAVSLRAASECTASAVSSTTSGNGSTSHSAYSSTSSSNDSGSGSDHSVSGSKQYATSVHSSGSCLDTSQEMMPQDRVNNSRYRLHVTSATWRAGLQAAITEADSHTITDVAAETRDTTAVQAGGRHQSKRRHTRGSS